MRNLQWVTIVLCCIGFGGLGCGVRQSTDTPMAENRGNSSSPSEAKDVESVLKRTKWQSRSGFSNGVSWQFMVSGKVLIQDGGETDESYRWEVISRNESEQKIAIKFWKPGNEEHQEWRFTFGGDGEPAHMDRFKYKGSKILDSDHGLLRYPVQ